MPFSLMWIYFVILCDMRMYQLYNLDCIVNEPCTSSVCLCTDASTTKILSTWWTTAHQYPTLPIVNGYGDVLPVVMKFLYHITGSVLMDVGHLPLLAWLSGTLCPRTCGIWKFLRTVTDSLWRRFYLCTVQRIRGFFTRMCYTSPHLTLTFDFDVVYSHYISAVQMLVVNVHI